MSFNQNKNVAPDEIRTPKASGSSKQFYVTIILIFTLKIMMILKTRFLEEATVADGLQDDASESFAFALVNGALGVFEVYGRRIRDFRLFVIKEKKIIILSSMAPCSNMHFFFLLDQNGQNPFSILLMG